MNLKQYYNKKVRITDDEGTVYKGVVSDYIYPEDNEPEVESIILDSDSHPYPIEFREKDILSITII